MIDQTKLMEFARDAGLPISWWENALKEGKTPQCWRELQLFANLIENHVS